MATESGVSIFPITVVGAFELMPPGSNRIQSGTIEIFFQEPIETEGLGASDRVRLMERVRVGMEDILAQKLRSYPNSFPQHESVQKAKPFYVNVIAPVRVDRSYRGLLT